MATIIEFSTNPYPGLRPFRYDESDVFFGREKQVDLLIERLAANRFLAVIGSSGCGKSSLVRAGLIPALNAGFMSQVGSRWRIVAMRPGERPLRQLTHALCDAHILGPARSEEEAAAYIEASLRRGPLGLVEVMRGADALGGDALLLLADQFEETFRYNQGRPSDEAEAFVALLLASASQRERPIYVVVTMRSDYLGECASFRGLAEAVSCSQYLTPRLTRDELERAIDGPARVFDGAIEPRLLNRLINDFGTDADQLPLLQHALACMWDRRFKAGETAPRLAVVDLDAIGGVRAALSRHADEIYDELTPEQQRIAEVMFKRLSGSPSGRRDVRAPARASEIAQIAGVHVDEVLAVADAFARADRSLIVSSEWPLHADSMLDMCHESLIRQWARLRDWSEQEAQSAEIYRLLEQTARRWRKGEAALWSTPDLEGALVWERRQRPNAMWARRYGGELEDALAFLRASEAKQRADVAAVRERERNRIRKYRRIAYALLAVVLIGSGARGYRYYFYDREYSAYFASTVDHWGVPEGYGPLTSQQVSERPWSIKITRRGRFGPVLRMMAVDQYGECQPENDVSPQIQRGSEDNALVNPKTLQECEWVFVPDASNGDAIDGVSSNGKTPARKTLVYEKAFNRKHDLVWGLAFAPHAVRNHQTAYFVGPDGSLASQQNARLHSVEYDYVDDPGNPARDGLQISEKFFSYAGGPKHPEPGLNDVYGVQREYDSNGLVVRRTNIGRDQRTPMSNADGVAIMTFRRNPFGYPTETAAFDAAGKPVLDKRGVHLTRESYDDNGNQISERFFGIDGKPVRVKEEHYHEARSRYEHGNPVDISFLDVDGTPVMDASLGVTRLLLAYDKGLWREERFVDAQGRPVTSLLGMQVMKMSYDGQRNMTSISFFDAYGKPAYNFVGIHKMEWSYGADGRRVLELPRDAQNRPARLKAMSVADVTLSAAAYGSKYSYDSRGNLTQLTFLDKSGAPITGGRRYAKYQRVYDDRGNAVEVDTLDALDRPVRLDSTGVARIVYRFDDRRNAIEENFYDERGAHTVGAIGYASVKRTYDDRNRVIEVRYLGIDGKPMLKGGSAVVRYRYDGRDNQTEEDYLDAADHPVTTGVARDISQYDERDRLIDVAYYDANGKPTLQDGVAGVHLAYDASGRNRTRKFYGVDGKPVLNENGCWAFFQRLDIRGNDLLTMCVDQSGKPMRGKDGFGSITTKYDAHGNTLEKTASDERGRFQTRPGDASRVVQEFDQYDNVISQRFFGPDGKPTTQPDGYAELRAKFDGANRLELSYFGVDGKPMMVKDGFATQHTAFDNHDNVTRLEFFGVGGKPIEVPSGYASERLRYDDRNNEIERAFYGANGELAMQSNGYAILRTQYDARNNPSEYAFFDADRKPVKSASGFAAMRFQYDGADHLTSETYFDEAGKPVCRDASYVRFCKLEHVYDATGREVENRYLDRDGHVLVTGSFTLDDQGHPIEARYAGARGEPLDFHETVGKVLVGEQGEKLLKKGDSILRYAGNPVDGPWSMYRLVDEPFGDIREVEILRDGKLMTLKAKPGSLGYIKQVSFVPRH